MKVIAAALLLSTSSLAFSDSFDATKAKIQQALKSDLRTEAETDRDRNRKPTQTLEFFGLRDDMTIVELIPGGGWYTKLLATVVAEKGQYYAAFGTGRIKKNVLNQPGFEKAKILAEDAKVYRKDGDRFYTLETKGLDVKGADMVLTFRNYHNFGDEGRESMNKAAFDALKSGGIYAVVDHTARHMEPMRDTNRRRFDPVKAIKEIEAAGFEFVDFSDLHYRQDDELLYEVGVKSVTGNTDRWTLKFRKP